MKGGWPAGGPAGGWPAGLASRPSTSTLDVLPAMRPTINIMVNSRLIDCFDTFLEAGYFDFSDDGRDRLVLTTHMCIYLVLLAICQLRHLKPARKYDISGASDRQFHFFLSRWGEP
jgi:hypothetical protein